MNNIVKAALGHTEAVGNPGAADVLMGHSFGTLIDSDSVNRALAESMLEHRDGRPMVADKMLADAFPFGAPKVDYIVEGQITNSFGRGVGTRGTLIAGKGFMETEGLTMALQIAEKHHIGRVAMQAAKLEIPSIIPAGLPEGFDPRSAQWQTRGQLSWLVWEVVGVVARPLQETYDRIKADQQ